MLTREQADRISELAMARTVASEKYVAADVWKTSHQERAELHKAAMAAIREFNTYLNSVTEPDDVEQPE